MSQKRPLSAMTDTQTGITSPVAVSNVATTVHVVDRSSPTNFLDEVTLYVTNNHTAAQVVDVDVLGTTLSLSIAASSTEAVLVTQPLFASPTATLAQASITVRNVTNTVADTIKAFGFFTR